MAQHVDWDDETVPVGKRKVVFVRWLMQKRGLSLRQAQAMSNSKFGPSAASAKRRSDQKDDAWRQREQDGIRQFGHPSQYETPMQSGPSKEQIDAYLARLMTTKPRQP